MAAGGLDESFAQAEAFGFFDIVEVHCQLLDSQTQILRRSIGGHGRAEMDTNRKGELSGQASQYFAVVVAEDAAPESADVGRDDLVVGALGDSLKAAAKLVKHSGAGERALGEDADQVAVVHGFAGFSQCGDNLFGRIGGADRNDPAQTEHPADPEILRDCPVHHKADSPLLGRHQHDGVSP